MLLKSASTPLLGSLLTSISESPNHFQCDASIKHTPSPGYNNILHCNSGTQFFSTFSCNSSPMSPALAFSKNGLVRRANSESNLESLVDSSNDVDEINLLNMPKKFQRKSNSSFLETIPSFSFHNNLSYGSDYEHSDEEDEATNDSSKKHELLGSVDQYSMTNRSVMMGYDIGYGNNVKYEDSGEMFLARGLGVAEFCFADVGGTCGGGGDSGGYRPVAFDKEGGDNNHGIGVEEHYKKMLEGSPSNPLYLRNYAQFLYQVKQDLEGAEEYYSRAILADPSDGEVLSQYAKLVWELHHDEERATLYFERAVQTASENSHVHAAYANFLWEVEDEVDETTKESHEMQSLFSTGAISTIAY
ncbi:hypothetical protein LIER_43012 [Lithospermum erythrorhizon]|uniref:TmcB/TmcC TPR repeats domain-containing protein n=1 Tax=Lithospermum erythrorhizon TaxID=34254 RepID=A0AAV3PB75_LITER